MTTFEPERIVERIAPLVPVLHEIGPAAVTAADEACSSVMGLPQKPIYHPTRVHLARAGLHRSLAVAPLDGWHLDEEQSFNTPVHLYSDGLALRMLHSVSLAPPAPGPNAARRAWYTNRPLIENDELFSAPEQMLLIWGADFAQGIVSFRVVHTTGPWRYGDSSKIDLSIWLDNEEDFESATFETRDEEEDLEMPSREEAEGEAAGHVSA